MASADDDLEYLSPSFDPLSLTIPKLRNILMSHDISYPASAKKPQLVDIFTQELKPKAQKILAARDRVRRTSRGITDMPSSQEGTVNGDNNDDDSMQPPPQRKPRKSGRVSAEPFSDPPAPTRASGGRVSSSKHARQSDTETDQDQPKRPAVRTSRKSEIAPRNKVERPKNIPPRPPMRESAFSDENPFQSGSSPLVFAGDRRRSAGTNSDRRKSSSIRRRTEGGRTVSSEQQDGISVPSSKTFEVPISSRGKLTFKDELDDGVEAGEEFTPEEQLELVRERAAQGKADILPPRKIKRSQKSRTLPKSAPWVFITALLLGYAIWWRQEKVATGYCGIGRPYGALSSVQLPEWMNILQPTCETCPQHAICYQGMETQCDHDFVLQPHPLSLGGLVPLPPTCEPDGEKARRVKSVADRAVEELRERRAQAECGTLKDRNGKHLSAEIDEQDLKEKVAKKKRQTMSEAEFEDLWKGAIGEIVGREEVESSSGGAHSLLSSTSLARVSLGCAIKRSARLTLARYRLPLSLVMLSGIGFLYIRSLIRTSRSDTARIPSLVTASLDRLATQAALYTRGDVAESWISVGQLRDDFLRDEFSDKRREDIWKRVRAVVEKNANVRASVREGRGGDVSRVWEWIGSIGLLGEAWSEGRRSGKRMSNEGFGDEGTPDSHATPNGWNSRQPLEVRKWDEGRPIY